jgi:hypothetical protein
MSSTKIGALTLQGDDLTKQCAKQISDAGVDIDWMQFVSNGTDTISFRQSGKGGLVQLAGAMDDASVMFGVCSMNMSDGQDGKFDQQKNIFVSWVGKGVTNGMHKAKAAMHKSDLMKFLRQHMTISAEFMAERKGELSVQAIKQALTRTRTDKSGEAKNSGGSAAGSIHAGDGQSTPNLGDGIYITQEYASEGTFYLNYSKTPVDGAIAFIKSGAAIAGFKYKQNGGKKEFARQIGGVFRKNYCRAWTGFFKMARDLKGSIQVFSNRVKDLSIWLCTPDAKGNIKAFAFDAPFDPTSVLGMAFMSKGTTLFNVQTMEPGNFANVGNTAPDGAAIMF